MWEADADHSNLPLATGRDIAHMGHWMACWGLGGLVLQQPYKTCLCPDTQRSAAFAMFFLR